VKSVAKREKLMENKNITQIVENGLPLWRDEILKLKPQITRVCVYVSVLIDLRK